MRISINFIKEFTEIDRRKAAELAERLSVSLTEVETVENFRGVDTVLHIENKALTHRPDCFSHLGIAREISTIYKTKFKDPIPKLNRKKIRFPKKKLPFNVKIENKEICPRYTAVVIKNIEIKPSPLEIQEKLLACGMKPINNVVDITNWVMLELGQPLHAFDYDKVKDHQIIVRNAKRNERITTLDGVQRELKTEMIVIADPEKAIGIAGIMGGVNSEVSEETKTILLESANFNDHNIRRTGKITGLHTDATLRFEKGQDPNLTYPALIRAISLLEENTDGKIASAIIDLYPNKRKERTISLDMDKVQKHIGIEIKRREMKRILSGLQINYVEKEETPNIIELEIPTFRYDLDHEQDFVEEIARIYGYDKLEPCLPTKTLAPAQGDGKREIINKILRILTCQGMDEIYSYSFVGESLYRKTLLLREDLLRIKNPLSPELEYLRDSLVPSVIEKASLNSREMESFGIFEMGKAIIPVSRKKLPEEKKKIVGLFYERKNGMEPFYLAKGVLEALFQGLGIESYQFVTIEKKRKFLDNNRAGSVMIKKEDELIEIAYLGEINQSVKSNFSIKGKMSIFEIDLENLVELSVNQITYKPIPKYPSVYEDLSLIVEKNLPVEKLRKTVKEASDQVMDVSLKEKPFYSNKLGTDRKSVTFTVEYRSPKKTLNGSDIKSLRTIILKKVKNNFKAQLRQ